MPVPPPSDLLATISMFEQIKAEPIGFYSACPPTSAGMSSQANSSRSGGSSGAESAPQQSVITSSNNEDNKDVVQQQSLIAVSITQYPLFTFPNCSTLLFQIPGVDINADDD